MNDLPEELHRLALDRVRRQYELIAAMRGANLRSMNRGLPRDRRYRSVDELVREWSTAAGAVSNFAFALGLISGEEQAQIIRDFHAAHPDVWPEDNGAGG